MSKFDEGLKLIEERCGNGKDNLLALATISIEPNNEGKPTPRVRDVDAYYEEGVFYISTYAKSAKMREIEQNKEVAFSVCGQWISGKGIGENIGWVKDEKNAEIRTKMKKYFKWFDEVGGEDSPDSIILRVIITQATVIKDHGAMIYVMDFVNKKEQGVL
ncbi:MAG: pyridoxamine 5'-phosphate oxidase family protein [Candidatus Cloacimonetes bacterium]|nr:pyridoxamine 5'-phosphate oxidase family protein [Candidatus Cloacimonadota bacterium]